MRCRTPQLRARKRPSRRRNAGASCASRLAHLVVGDTAAREQVAEGVEIGPGIVQGGLCRLQARLGLADAGFDFWGVKTHQPLTPPHPVARLHRHLADVAAQLEARSTRCSEVTAPVAVWPIWTLRLAVASGSSRVFGVTAEESGCGSRPQAASRTHSTVAALRTTLRCRLITDTGCRAAGPRLPDRRLSTVKPL